MSRLDAAVVAVGRSLGALAAAQESVEIFDPLAFEEAAAQVASVLPAPASAVDAIARLLGIGNRLAEEWLRETVALLREGDQDDPAVRDRGSRRIAILALAWR